MEPQQNQNTGKSEIALFLEQWDTEMEAIRRALHGYAITGRHDFITRRIQRFGDAKMKDLLNLEEKKMNLEEKKEEEVPASAKQEGTALLEALQAKQAKAKEYTSQPERFKIFIVGIDLTTDDGELSVFYGEDQWDCTCPFFQVQKTCEHVMTVGHFLKSLPIAQPCGNEEIQSEDGSLV